MKRITILSQFYYPEIGAPQNRLLETVEGLKTLGWEVQVVTALPNYPTGKIFDTYKGKFKVVETSEKTEIIRHWIYPSISKNALPRLLSMISFSVTSLFSISSIRKFRPTYIFTESPPLTLGVTGLILSKCCNAKHILNISDIWPLSAFELGALKKGMIYRSIEKIEHFLYRKSHACTGQSEGIIKHLKKNGAKKIHLYRNGICVEKYKAKQNGKTDKLRIVYAGLLGVAQDIYSICKYIDFENCEFHIYGDGVQTKQIEELLRSTRKSNIILHKSIPSTEVTNELIKYDIALIPLAKEILGAVPSKIYEAMAVGLPIVYSGGGEGNDIIISNEIGWTCKPSDYTEISNTIQLVSQLSSNKLYEYSSRSRNAAELIFDRKIQIKNLDTFLSNL